MYRSVPQNRPTAGVGSSGYIIVFITHCHDYTSSILHRSKLVKTLIFTLDNNNIGSHVCDSEFREETMLEIPCNDLVISELIPLHIHSG